MTRGKEGVADIRLALGELKHRLEIEPAVPIEEAAQLCAISARTIRRRLHLFEVKRDRRNHIFITLRSIQRFIEIQRYQPSVDFDARKAVKDVRKAVK